MRHIDATRMLCFRRERERSHGIYIQGKRADRDQGTLRDAMLLFLPRLAGQPMGWAAVATLLSSVQYSTLPRTEHRSKLVARMKVRATPTHVIGQGTSTICLHARDRVDVIAEVRACRLDALLKPRQHSHRSVAARALC